MMTEQQMTLKNDDLQDRWTRCVRMTCLSARICKLASCAMSRITEILSNLIKSMAEYISDVFSSIGDLISESIQKIRESFEGVDFSSSVSIPRPKYNTVVRSNSKGFSKPVLYRARSRC